MDSLEYCYTEMYMENYPKVLRILHSFEMKVVHELCLPDKLISIQSVNAILRLLHRYFVEIGKTKFKMKDVNIINNVEDIRDNNKSNVFHLLYDVV